MSTISLSTQSIPGRSDRLTQRVVGLRAATTDGLSQRLLQPLLVTSLHLEHHLAAHVTLLNVLMCLPAAETHGVEWEDPSAVVGLAKASRPMSG